MMEHKNFHFDLKSSGDAGEIEGYGSTFWNVDSYGDRVASGAFAGSIKTRMPRMLWQHDQEKPIGKWLSAEEDDNGLRVKGRLALGTDQGRNAYELVKEGVLDSLSIGYRTLKSFNEGNVRVLKELDLWEVSLVTFPANDAAVITGIKSELTARDLERMLRQSGFSRTEAKAITARGYDGYAEVLRDAGIGDTEGDQRDADELKQLLEIIMKGANHG
jgi:uncharacterized protein